jgi:hypothetical protein
MTPNGNQFGPKGYSDSLHFMVSADMAAKLAKVGLKADKYYNVKLTCAIIARGLGVRGYRFLVNVLRVEFFATPRPVPATKPPPVLKIEQVDAAPNQYDGQTVIFGNVTLDGRIERHDGIVGRWYSLTLYSTNGNRFSGLSYIDGRIAFLTSAAMYPKLVDAGMIAGRQYSVRLTCTIEKMRRSLYGDAWVAQVTQIDFLDNDGKVLKTVK